MMRYFFLIFLLYFSSSVNAQKSDTLFLKRITSNKHYSFYNAIFVDTSAKFKSVLTNFDIDEKDDEMYFKALSELKNLKNQKNYWKDDFPKRWTALYQHKGKYYLYCPSDLGFHKQFEVTDSTLVSYGMEGFQPSQINKISFPSSSLALIDVSNAAGEQQVQIKIIDSEKGIAVFSISQLPHNDLHKVLMVDASKIHLFPVIVNYCATDKVTEFDFDVMDFDKL